MKTDAAILTRQTPPNPQTKVVVRRVIFYAALAVLAIPFVLPTWWMITSSLKPISEIFAFPPTLWPANPTLDGYVKAFEMQRITLYKYK